MAVVVSLGWNMVITLESSRNHRVGAEREDLAELLSEKGGELLQSRHTLKRIRSGADKM